MTKTIFILLSAATLLVAGAAMAAQPLKVGISAEPYPPFTYKSASGDWTGFEVDIATAICAEMERACETTPTAWSGIIPALNSGKIDMIIGSMSITDERKKMVSFSDPYYQTGFAFVAPKSMAVEIPDGLSGKMLGVQSATMAAKFAREQLGTSGVQFRFYPKQEQLNRDLLAHRVDLMVADSIAMFQFVKRDDAADYEVKKVTPPYSEGVAVVLRKSDDELRQQINQAIATVLDNGTCHELSQQYFDADICAGQ